MLACRMSALLSHYLCNAQPYSKLALISFLLTSNISNPCFTHTVKGKALSAAHLWPVGGSQQQHALAALEAIQLRQQLVQCLVALLVQADATLATCMSRSSAAAAAVVSQHCCHLAHMPLLHSYICLVCLSGTAAARILLHVQTALLEVYRSGRNCFFASRH